MGEPRGTRGSEQDQEMKRVLEGVRPFDLGVDVAMSAPGRGFFRSVFVLVDRA